MSATKKLLLEIAREAGLLPQAKRIWSEHPLLEQISSRVAEFIGMHPKDETGKPLLIAGIVGAISAYQITRRQKNDGAAAVKEYLLQIVRAAAKIFSQDVCVETPSGKVRWMPLEQTASEFFEKNPSEVVIVEPRERTLSPNMAISFIVLKTVPHAVLDDVGSLFEELKGSV